MSSYTDNHFKKGLSDLQLVSPCIEKALGCKLRILDKENGELDALLDYNAGIDAIAQMPSGKLKGIAFRVQAGRNWQSFTIRSKRSTGNDTELQKFDPTGSYLSPTHIIQVYIEDGSISIGIADYKTLMQYVIDNLDALPTRIANVEKNEFKVVEWRDIEWITQKRIECEACKRV